MRKRKLEFSKKILYAIAIMTVIIIAFSMLLMWKTGDLSPLAYLIPGIFAELATSTGFYYWKAKNENVIKINNSEEDNLNEN